MDYRDEWDRKNTVQVKLKLNKNTDADILAWLDRQGSKQGSIKDLIRESMSKTHG